MTLGEVKQVLYGFVKQYHPNATVEWEKTRGVTPKPPYITLGYGNLERSLFPLDDDGLEHRYYNYSFRFEVNLYTVGKEILMNGSGTGTYENTAVEDLEEFIRFLDSEKLTAVQADKELSVTFNPPIRDLSELTGDTKFNYRSMAEFTVAYVGTADGEYGVYGKEEAPNSSGGGTAEMAGTPTEGIEDVEIKEGGNT